jgi:hypothetical protein
MIKFNSIQIALDNSFLAINAEVLSDSQYDTFYINKIVIDNNDTYTINGASETPVYEEEFDTGTREIDLKIPSNTITNGIENKMFIVYVYVKDTTNPNTLTVQSYGVFNYGYFYRRSLNYLSEFCGCNNNVPNNFINYSLQAQAIDFSIRTGNYIKAVTLFNKFITL